jgi:hypothetical protein
MRALLRPSLWLVALETLSSPSSAARDRYGYEAEKQRINKFYDVRLPAALAFCYTSTHSSSEHLMLCCFIALGVRHATCLRLRRANIDD